MWGPMNQVVPVPPPSAAGWAGAAMAIHSIQQIPRPILISLEPTAHPPIAIDLRAQGYVWATPLNEFPPAPAEVRVGTYPVDSDAPGLGGRVLGIDPLLWMIGLNAFEGGRASWLRPGDKYRLKWWPEFELLPHTANHARAVKTLARSMMTVDKLATLAKIEVGEAHAVVNALSLMGALRRLESRDAAPALPPVSAEWEAPDRSRGRHVRRGG